ncbi:MAG: carboxypeptidase regulatory-like domain-containing protein [Cyclobacteriaceae bacterium]|nr:carboxypeptidase regulatory-like domain-containing protein [Cyclobacteriaceae bacterium]
MKKIILVLILVLPAMPLLGQQQGIKGKVEWISGNQMPGPDQPPSKPLGIKREIWIYQATTIDQVSMDGVFFSDIPTFLVKKVKSNKKGCFKATLPPGDYSLFIKEKYGLFANRFDGQNRVNCLTVKPGEFIEITIRVDYEAAY